MIMMNKYIINKVCSYIMINDTSIQQVLSQHTWWSLKITMCYAKIELSEAYVTKPSHIKISHFLPHKMFRRLDIANQSQFICRLWKYDSFYYKNLDHGVTGWHRPPIWPIFLPVSNQPSKVQTFTAKLIIFP